MLSKQLWIACSRLFSRSVIEISPGCPRRLMPLITGDNLGFLSKKEQVNYFLPVPVPFRESGVSRGEDSILLRHLDNSGLVFFIVIAFSRVVRNRFVCNKFVCNNVPAHNS
jgi:hypothetical protein